MTSVASRPLAVRLELPVALDEKLKLLVGRGVSADALIVETLAALIDLCPKERAVLANLARDMVLCRTR